MDTTNIETEQGLRDIYYNPSTGYQSTERLYQKAIEEGLSVSSRITVKEWLKSQDTYTRHVGESVKQIQLDLVDMGKYKDKNRGYYWILTGKLQ